MNRRLGAGCRRSELAVWLLILVVGGCGSISVANDLATRLEYEGYTAVSVEMSADAGGDIVTVRARGNPKLSDEDSVDSLQTAIWNTLPRRFDTLDIRVGGERRQTSYQQLSQRFGPRDRSLDDRQIGTDVSTVVITASVVAGLVVVLLGVLAAMLWRRRRWEDRQQTDRFELNYPPAAG